MSNFTKELSRDHEKEKDFMSMNARISRVPHKWFDHSVGFINQSINHSVVMLIVIEH